MRISRKAKKFGFTLAEVLITLTIIGVVAAMTIPTLLMKHQKQTYVTGLKKAYATLTNAMQMLPIERGCPAGDYVCAGFFGTDNDGQDINLTIDGQTFSSYLYARTALLSKVLNVKTICIGNTTAECYTNNKADDAFIDSYFGQLILNDGMAIALGGYFIYADVNGISKGPNKPGRDIFRFHIATKNKNDVLQGTIIPTGSQLNKQYGDSGSVYWKDANTCNGQNITSNCTGRVLEEDAMNY